MSAATLLLLRHGAHVADGVCCGAATDPVLAPAGRRQAAAAAARLGAVDAVVSSPLARAVQTAAAWTEAPTVDSRLVERDFGRWEGRRWSELWAEAPAAVQADAAAYAAFTPPDAEPLARVRERVVDAVRRWTDEPGRSVLAVTHAGPLRLAVAWALGLDDARAFALAAEPGRAAVLQRHGDAWSLQALGA